jgi:hypothetical protein
MSAGRYIDEARMDAGARGSDIDEAQMHAGARGSGSF